MTPRVRLVVGLGAGLLGLAVLAGLLFGPIYRHGGDSISLGRGGAAQAAASSQAASLAEQVLSPATAVLILLLALALANGVAAGGLLLFALALVALVLVHPAPPEDVARLVATARRSLPAQAGRAVAPAVSARQDLELQIIAASNQARQARALPPLAVDDGIGQLARERSEDMAQNNYFSHYAPDGTLIFGKLLLDHQVAFVHAAENLAWDTYPDETCARMTVDDWIASPEHAANLFSRDYDRVGIGVVSADSQKYVTLLFIGDH